MKWCRWAVTTKAHMLRWHPALVYYNRLHSTILEAGFATISAKLCSFNEPLCVNMGHFAIIKSRLPVTLIPPIFFPCGALSSVFYLTFPRSQINTYFELEARRFFDNQVKTGPSNIPAELCPLARASYSIADKMGLGNTQFTSKNGVNHRGYDNQLVRFESQNHRALSHISSSTNSGNRYGSARQYGSGPSAPIVQYSSQGKSTAYKNQYTIPHPGFSPGQQGTMPAIVINVSFHNSIFFR